MMKDSDIVVGATVHMDGGSALYTIAEIEGDRVIMDNEDPRLLSIDIARTQVQFYWTLAEATGSESEEKIMSDTARYTVSEHAVYSRSAGRGGYATTYSVRLPDVQQVPGAATRYLETAAGRRRAWRSRAAAQCMADALNVTLDRVMAKLEDEAREIGRSHGYDHANYAYAYGEQLKREDTVEVPAQFEAVATFYVAAYIDGQEAYEDEQTQDED